MLVNTFSTVFANSRIAFSRPGDLLKTPSLSFNEENPYIFTITASSEIVNFSSSQNQSSSGLSVMFQNRFGYNFGFTVAKPVISEFSEFGFHFQKVLLQQGDVTITGGIHDMLYNRNGNDVILTNDISFFGLLTSKKSFEDYTLSINFGGGIGKIYNDPHTEQSLGDQAAGIFLGFNLKTPYLIKNGGIDLIFEYDGQGANIGVKIPFTNDYSMGFGLTHFENFGQFGTESNEDADYMELQPDAPAISIGLTMTVPALSKGKVLDGTPYNLPYSQESQQREDELIVMINELQDSVDVLNLQLTNMADFNLYMKQKIAVLMDSSRVFHLEKQVVKSNMNEVMRHLSRSLRYFYNEEYRDALAEVDTAIDINPNISLAYARRGSIYYWLGDHQRATMNWNIALKLDPEFSEIQELLSAAKENRIQATTGLNE